MARHIRHLAIGFTVTILWGVSPSLAQQPAPEDKPDNYLGKTVTVEGEVDKALGPHLFTIDERQWADAARELPVSVPAPFMVGVTKGAMVRVTGTIERIPIDRLEKEIGPIVDATLRGRLANRPVLVATAVSDTVGGKSLLSRKGS